MKARLFSNFVVLIILAGAGAILVSRALAQRPSALPATAKTAKVQFPVAELGNCSDPDACRAFCDQPKNTAACLSFAEKNNLMSPKEIRVAQKFLAAGEQRPGNCRNKDECETYCDSLEHLDECLSFAEKNDLLPAPELEQAKKVQAAIKRGVKPPACQNKKACDAYCDRPDHLEECLAFGEAAGFIQGKELEDARKMLGALKRGVPPLPCHGKENCEQYCAAPENLEACLNFALAAGFISDQERDNSQKMLAAVKKGVRPPACRGQRECDAYCAEKEHFEECLNFAEAAGFLTAEEAVTARKTGGESPGNCRGKEECQAFCQDPANQETCFDFARKHGLVPEADLKKTEEAQQQMRQALEGAPPAAQDCLNSALGSQALEKIRQGDTLPSQEIGEKISECFQKTMRPPVGPAEQESPAQPGQQEEKGKIPPPGEPPPIPPPMEQPLPPRPSSWLKDARNFLAGLIFFLPSFPGLNPAAARR